MPEFGESNFEQKREVSIEEMGGLVAALYEEYAVFALDRGLQMTEVEYLKLVDMQNRLPDLDDCNQEVLSEELIISAALLSEMVSTSLKEMEEYFRTHGDTWKDMTN